MELRRRTSSGATKSSSRTDTQTILVTADIHLSANPAHEYRWKLFPLLKKLAKLHKAEGLWVLGDLTDAKDRHPGEFVNRLTDEFLGLQPAFDFIEILKGNHDYSRNGEPFFRFLSKFPRIRYYSDPFQASRFGHACHFIPHTTDGNAVFSALQSSHADVLLLHHTFNGAMAGSVALEGTDASVVKKKGRLMLSGDVHMPQVVGPVEYVGAPYHQTFGDSFSPRVGLLTFSEEGVQFTGIPTYGEFPSKRTVVASSKEELLWALINCEAGDDVRVRLSLSKADFFEFEELRVFAQDRCIEHGLHLHGVEILPRKVLTRRSSAIQAQLMGTSTNQFSAYCAKANVPKSVQKAGSLLLKELP
jgi:predicted phosphodiesterase